MEELTPQEIVSELNKYIVGQDDAKKAVAIALRNRFRREKLPSDIKEEIYPKKYYNDWTYRCRENRNCTKTC